VVPEGYGFGSRLTGREYVEWAIDIKEADDDPDEILEPAGVEGDAGRTTGDYSKGMQQRLASGVALVGDPDPLILGEPSTGLAHNGIQQIRSVIRERADDGTAVFFSSHILSGVEAVCDRVGMMNEGELVAMDTIEGLWENARGNAVVELTCAEPPAVDRLADIDGVTVATTEGPTLTVQCCDPTVKVDIVRSVDERADIVDILAENTSLEELFSQCTDDGTGRTNPQGHEVSV